MRPTRTALLLAIVVNAAGCFAYEPDPPTTSPGYSSGVSGGGPAPGAPAQQVPTVRVLPGASASIPDGDLGFVITADGQGGYRLAWTDTYGSAARFAATITTDGTFDASQVAPIGGAAINQVDAQTLEVGSTPYSGVDGVDLVSSTDPIYLDLTVDGARTGFGIYYTNLTGLQTTAAYNPLAATSP